MWFSFRSYFGCSAFWMVRLPPCSYQDWLFLGFIYDSISYTEDLEIEVTDPKVSHSPGKLRLIFGIIRGIDLHDFISTHYSFFPSILQPVITILVNPLHNIFLRVGIIKPHAILRNSAHSLTSVVSVQNVDMHDMERRRQIALKALSERLSRTTDSSRQKILPKSFPHHHQGHGHGHGHAHGQFHNFSDSDQPSFIASPKMMEFTIPAIPLPPPPSMQTQSSETAAQSTSAALINLETQNNQTTNNSWSFNWNVIEFTIYD